MKMNFQVCLNVFSVCMHVTVDSLINPAAENSDSDDVFQDLHHNETGTCTFT